MKNNKSSNEELKKKLSEFKQQLMQQYLEREMIFPLMQSVQPNCIEKDELKRIHKLQQILAEIIISGTAEEQEEILLLLDKPHKKFLVRLGNEESVKKDCEKFLGKEATKEIKEMLDGFNAAQN